MRIYLGSDHAGFDLKNAIAAHLKKAGHEVIDCGAHEYDALDDYPRTYSMPTSYLLCTAY